jgi:hypothetical protein
MSPNKMDRNTIDNYNKIKADAEAVLAAADYTPDKMMWECWGGLENPAAKKVLTDAAGRTYTFTAGMTNLGIYDLHVAKEGEHSVNIHSFCDRS